MGRLTELDGVALHYRMQAPRNAIARGLQVITSSDNCSNVQQNTRHRDIYDILYRRVSLLLSSVRRLLSPASSSLLTDEIRRSVNWDLFALIMAWSR